LLRHSTKVNGPVPTGLRPTSSPWVSTEAGETTTADGGETTTAPEETTTEN